MMRSTLTRTILSCLFCGIIIMSAFGQHVEPIAYGDMDRWVTRHVKESAVIGGAAKTLYEVGPVKTIDDNKPYSTTGGSPWGTSNIMAKVAGIVKTNNSVFSEPRGNGHCARLETRIEGVTVLGLVDINVIATGSMFLGYMREPITGTKDALKFMVWGVPFNRKPKALRYDYKLKLSNSPNRIRMTGFSRKGTVSGRDCAITTLYLQQRHEDANGNITAKRIGTLLVKYDKSTKDWVNNATYEILYGDIRNNPAYVEQWMGLQRGVYTVNSKGNVVEIIETEWGTPDDTPTHLMLQFSSSHGGAFVGNPGNTMWIDNVKLVY